MPVWDTLVVNWQHPLVDTDISDAVLVGFFVGRAGQVFVVHAPRLVEGGLGTQNIANGVALPLIHLEFCGSTIHRLQILWNAGPNHAVR